MTLPSTLNPWREKGIPLDQQVRSWKEIVREPYHKHEVDAYTRTRVILMNGIENGVWAQSHAFFRSAGNPEIRALLARTRRIEDQQVTTINWLNPADQSVLETTIAYEQVAIDLTAYLARNEPDRYVREAFHFGLLEDFDHLYRYSELLDYLQGLDPNSIVQGKTEILPGRPTEDHHNDPELRLRKHYEKNRALPLSKIHTLTLLLGEQQTRNFYKEHGPEYGNRLARELYAEISEVEEEHVTFYGSLLDPTETPIERQLLHELVEVYNYFHCYEQEVDVRLKALWEQFLAMELTHVQLWGDMMRKYEGREPEVVFGNELSVDFKFTENKEYLRQVLEFQRDVRLRPLGQGYMMKDEVSGKKDASKSEWPSHRYQETVNAGGNPSEEVVDIQRTLPARPLDIDYRPGDELLERARQVALSFRNGGKD